MPVLKDEPKTQIAGAIEFPQRQNFEGDINGEEDNTIPQPRQPTNLQGLLRFAMEVENNQGGSAAGSSQHLSMDEERRKFLEEAIKSMTVDVIEVLQSQIKILQDVKDLKADSDVSEKTQAFDVILEYVDHIDIANDFHKIGGFAIFDPCLKCSNAKIRAGACDILAELCQNNPYCQRVAVQSSYVPLLLNMLEKDEDNQVCVKAMYALSCIIRDNVDGYNQFMMYSGLNILAQALKRNEDKLRTKTTFLLAALCRSKSDLISRLVFLEYVPILINLLKENRMPSHEHILSLLTLLVRENQTAANECKKPDHNLKEILLNHLEIIRNKDECREEEEYCKQLLAQLFTSFSNGL